MRSPGGARDTAGARGRAAGHDEARQLVADGGGALSVAAIIGLQGLAIALRLPIGLDDSAGFFNGIALAGLAVLLGARGSALMVRVREAAREGISRGGDCGRRGTARRVRPGDKPAAVPEP